MGADMDLATFFFIPFVWLFVMDCLYDSYKEDKKRNEEEGHKPD